MKVLVVDDDIHSRRLAQYMLMNVGCEVHTAPDGHAAVDIFKEGGFDFIFLDWNMPGINGGETLLEMDRQRGCEKTSVVIYSSQNPLTVQFPVVKNLKICKFVEKKLAPIRQFQAFQNCLKSKFKDFKIRRTYAKSITR